MFEEDDEVNNLDFDAQLERFESMLKEGKSFYFDVEIFEEIIDHYMGLNEYKKALRGIDMGLTQHPGNTNLLLLKSDLYVSTGKLSKALECLNIIEQVEPYNSEVAILKASVYSQQRKFEEAIYYLKQAIKHSDEEDRVDLYIDLAVEYENAEKYDKAISCLQHALDINPENETAMYEISYCYEIAGKNQASIAFYKDFIDKHPYSYLAWHNLGTSLIKDGKLEEAVEAFDYCLAINEDFSTAHFNKATVLMMEENYPDAITHFTETVLLDEALPLTFLYLGECYEKIAEYVLAEQNYIRAFELDEEFAEAFVALALLKSHLHAGVEAEYYINKAISLDEINADFWYIKAEISETNGLLGDAKKAYEKAVSLDEDNIEILLDYSSFIHTEFGAEDAVALLMDKYSKFSGIDIYEFRLSALYFILGKRNLSFEHFEKGLLYNAKTYSAAFSYCQEMEQVPEFQQLISIYNND